MSHSDITICLFNNSNYQSDFVDVTKCNLNREIISFINKHFFFLELEILYCNIHTVTVIENTIRMIDINLNF